LRVHGVGGSSGETMLEHPHCLQVGGDGTTMFLRRWVPDGGGRLAVPWRLEAYSWGGLTEAPLASALWILLAPFMFYNVAHFALPPLAGGAVPDEGDTSAGGVRFARDGRHAVAAALLRLAAVTSTAQFTLMLVVVFIDGLALQPPSYLAGWLPTAASGRVVAGLVAVGVVLAGVWYGSTVTACRYEARIANRRPEVHRDLILSQPGFWDGWKVVRRARSLHTATGLAVVAVVVARPEASVWADGVRSSVVVVAAATLVAVAVLLVSGVADRHTQSAAVRQVQSAADESAKVKDPALRLCQATLVAGALAFVGCAFTGGWGGSSASPGLPGVSTSILALLTGQSVVLILLGVVVATMKRTGILKRPKEDNLAARILLRPLAAETPERRQERGPFARGQLATVMVVLGACLGDALTGAASNVVDRVLRTVLRIGAEERAATLPRAVSGLALVAPGLLVGVAVAGVWIAWTWWHNVRIFLHRPSDRASAVARFYDMKGEDGACEDADDDDHRQGRRVVARTWATALIVDQAGIAATCAALGGVVGLITGELSAAGALMVPPGLLRWLGDVDTWAVVAVASVILALLRADLGDPTRRRTIGAVWDVATVWPRACHPLAPPCYGERAVPELVDRVQLLTGTVPRQPPSNTAGRQIIAHRLNHGPTPGALMAGPGRVLLTGYSQGAVIAPAVVGQLPRDVSDQVSLLTLASPTRRLYGRAFPTYFGPRQLEVFRQLLDPCPGSSGPARWKNLVRRSDYIGSWLFARPDPREGSSCSAVKDVVDQPSWDPEFVFTPLDQSRPPIHRHSSFWADVRVTQLGGRLMRVDHSAGNVSDERPG
jgi:hypothetical protein